MLAIAEEQHPAYVSSPSLMVSLVQRSPVIRIKSVAAAALSSPASGLAWLSLNRILLSAGNQLAIMKLNDSVLRTRSQLPAFHSDDIRDIQVSLLDLWPGPLVTRSPWSIEGSEALLASLQRRRGFL